MHTGAAALERLEGEGARQGGGGGTRRDSTDGETARRDVGQWVKCGRSLDAVWAQASQHNGTGVHWVRR